MMVASTAEAGTGLFCTWAQGFAPTPYPQLVAPTGAPGPQDYPCLPLGWAALAQATHLLLLLLRTPRGPARCTGASWETLSAQGARYGGGRRGSAGPAAGPPGTRGRAASGATPSAPSGLGEVAPAPRASSGGHPPPRQHFGSRISPDMSKSPLPGSVAGRG